MSGRSTHQSNAHSSACLQDTNPLQCVSFHDKYTLTKSLIDVFLSVLHWVAVSVQSFYFPRHRFSHHNVFTCKLVAAVCTTHRLWPRFHGHLKPSLMPLSVVLKITPRFHGHLKASLKPHSGVIKLTLPIETPVIHGPQSWRVGGALPHKSYSSLSWVDQTANGCLRGQSPWPGFAVIGPFEPRAAGAGTVPPRCHPPPDGGALRHVNNSLPGPLSDGSVHGNGSRKPDNRC